MWEGNDVKWKKQGAIPKGDLGDQKVDSVKIAVLFNQLPPVFVTKY